MRSIPRMLYETNKTALLESLNFIEMDIKRCKFKDSTEGKLLNKLREIRSVLNQDKYDKDGGKDEGI